MNSAETRLTETRQEIVCVSVNSIFPHCYIAAYRIHPTQNRHTEIIRMIHSISGPQTIQCSAEILHSLSHSVNEHYHSFMPVIAGI